MKPLLLFIFATLLFSACESSQVESTTKSAAAPTKIAAREVATPTPTPTLTPTPTPQPEPRLSFRGKECTGDCDGHEAGYDWAARKGIDDVSDCGGKSQSFIEGCESYVEENNFSSSDSDEADSDY